MNSREMLVLVVAGFCGMLVGNYMGDSKGTVTCNVLKEKQVENVAPAGNPAQENARRNSN